MTFFASALQSPMTKTLRRVLELAIDPDLPENTAVFHSRSGGLLWSNNVRRSFRRFVASSGIEMLMDSVGEGDITPHAFRRTVGTELANKHGLEAARDVLGHGQVATTEASYAKRESIVRAELGDLVEALLGPDDDKPAA